MNKKYLDRVNKWLFVSMPIMAISGTAFDSVAVSSAGPAIADELALGSNGLGQVMAAHALGLGLSVVLWGFLSDKLGERWIFTAGASVCSAGALTSALSFCFAELLVGRVLQGVGAAMLQACAVPVLLARAPRGRHTRLIGLATTGVSVGLLVGPCLSDLLLRQLGWQGIFWSECLFNAVLIAHVLMQSIWPPQGVEEPSVFFPRPYVAENKSIISIGLSTAAFGIATGTIFMATPALVTSSMSGWGRHAGMPLFAIALGMVCGGAASFAWERDSATSSIKTACGLAAMGAGSCVIFGATAPVAIDAGLLLYGAGGGIFQASSTEQIVAAGPWVKRSTAIALQRMLQSFGIAVGSQVTGFILDGLVLGSCRDAWRLCILPASVLGACLLLTILRGSGREIARPSVAVQRQHTRRAATAPPAR